MKTSAKSELYRELPSIDELLRTASVAALVAEHGAAAVTDAARAVLARLRNEIASGLLETAALQLALGGLCGAIEGRLRQELRQSLRTVINATGVILHTNLGRAPLAKAAIEHIRETAGRYSNLEYDVEAGARGKRDVHVERLVSGVCLWAKPVEVTEDAARLRPFDKLKVQAFMRDGREAAVRHTCTFGLDHRCEYITMPRPFYWR